MRRSFLSSRFAAPGTLALTLALGGCAPGPSAPTGPSQGSDRAARLTITTNLITLARRVHDARGEALAITADAGDAARSGATALKPAAAAHDISLHLLATVDPPVVGGVTLQATHISMK